MFDCKFRVYDTVEKKMIDPFDRDSSWATGFFWFEENGIRTMHHCLHRYVVMFSTGVKDCNGKEIFGGDITKTRDGYLREVVWDGGAYHLRELNWQPNKGMASAPLYFYYISSESSLEVIANRYEHENQYNIWAGIGKVPDSFATNFKPEKRKCSECHESFEQDLPHHHLCQSCWEESQEIYNDGDGHDDWGDRD